MNGEPRWLRWLEKRMGWIAIPHISILLVTLQALGFLFVSSNPAWLERLALVPEQVLAGEYWRLVTFLSLPLSYHPFWLFFVLWFLYFIVESLEQAWGAFKTTLYVLVSLLITIVYSLATGYPVTQIGHFESTLFLAAAAMFPEQQISLFMVIPVKLRWLGWLTGILVLREFVVGNWYDRFYLLAIYSSFLIFFGSTVSSSFRASLRRRRFKRNLRD